MISSFILAVSFAAGLNIYATLWALGMMSRFGWVVLPSGLDAVASWWVIAAATVMFSAEFVADKIPGFDLVWNLAHTFIRIPLAALLAFGAASHLPPTQQALATLLGTAVASVVHGSKLAARVLVTPSPEPVSNTLLSVGEDVMALAFIWAATHYVLLAGAISVALMLGGVMMIAMAMRLRRKPRT